MIVFFSYKTTIKPFNFNNVLFVLLIIIFLTVL